MIFTPEKYHGLDMQRERAGQKVITKWQHETKSFMRPS
jgi:hypothetical protein